jgi:transcriptional regulator with XRE-family HTH domain
LTQAEFAEAAGVSRSALQRLEGGESVQLTSFIKMLRALDLLRELDALLPEQLVLPVAAFERDRARARRRVRHSRAEERSGSDEPFVWGDEGEDG